MLNMIQYERKNYDHILRVRLLVHIIRNRMFWILFKMGNPTDNKKVFIE